jgi:protein O-GlcNAc transferase
LKSRLGKRSPPARTVSAVKTAQFRCLTFTMAKISRILEEALRHHQVGNLQQAELMYRQVLTQQPNQPDALHLLGLLAHQVGQSDVAIAYITQAIQADRRNPNFYNSIGEAYRALSRWDEAISSYKQAIKLQPNHLEAHCNLGITFQTKGEIEDAIASYRKALKLQPQIARIQNNLGVLLKQQGKLDEAIAAYRAAIKLKPDYIEALNNLGVVLEAKGEIASAIATYQTAIQLSPYSHDAYKNLGDALQSEQHLDEAIAAYKQAIALKMDFAEAHYNLGNAFKAQGQSEQAINSYNRALLIKHNWAEADLSLGHLFRDLGRVDDAIASYQKVLRDHTLDPKTEAEAEWNLQLILPILYDHPEQILEWRNRFAIGLQNLIQQTSLNNPASRAKALAGISSNTNFYLQYQGFDDTELQRQYGQLFHQIMAANYPNYSGAKHTTKKSSSKIRIGYISSHLRSHTVAQLFLGWLSNHDKSVFEVFCYHTGQRFDAMTASFQQCSDAFHHIPENFPNSFDLVCQQILSDRLDVLVFTDIGMSTHTDKVAALRLAPIQYVAWGHPITSGLPTIDYFLSSDLMEPTNADSHYTEKLIRLPGIGISYPKPVLPSVRTPRSHFNLRDEAVVYLSCQSLYKYLPQYDYIFAAIASQVPNAQFAFLSSLNSSYITDKFQKRLQLAFANLDLDYRAFCVFIPRLDRDDYLNLNLVSDIFLDTISWSGGNTTLEAIACNLPIVTLPGEFMRGRHAYAMLQMLEVTEAIASSEQDYIAIATRLGLDQRWRQSIVENMQARFPSGCTLPHQLYNDKKCIQALEEWLRKQK